jgi:hypothetical protein
MSMGTINVEERLQRPERVWEPERHSSSSLGNHPILSAVGLLGLGLAVVGAIMLLPDLKRYIRIKTM